MSLFERIQNRRYNLQEGIDDKGNITPNPGDKKVEKSIVRNYNKKQKKFNQTNVTSSGRVKATSDILKSGSKPTVSQQKTADDVLGNLNRFFTDKSDSDTLKTKSTGDEGQFKGKPKKFKITGDVSSKASKVNQADVSKKAKEYTKKINKQRIVKQKNIFGGEDTVKTKKKTSSSTSSASKTKTPTVQGQKKLNLGTYTKGKVQPTQTLKPGGVIKTDLRTVPKKTKKAGKRSPLAKPPKPEKMVTVKDPVKGGFKEVGATTKQGRKVLKTKQSISTDELLGNKKKIEKKIVSNTKNLKNTSKPSLFKRTKDALKGFHNYMVKDAGYRKTASKNLTRNTFKNTLRGNTLRTINKVLPGKYKALALATVGTAIAVDQALKNRKAAASGVDTKKPVYKKAVKTLNLDTGKKNN